MIRIFFSRVFALLTFRSFRPERVDYRHPLARRMRGRTLALLNVGPGGIKVGSAKLSKDKRLELLDSKYHPVTALNDDIIKELHNRTDCDSVALCFNAPTSLCDCHNIVRFKDIDIPTKLLRDPKSIYGEHHEVERVYALLQHPKLEIGLSFSFVREELIKVTDVLARSGFTVIRTQMGSYNLLNYLLAQPNFLENAPPPVDTIRIPLVMDQTFATAVYVLNGNWGPQSLVSHRSIVPSVLNRNQDPFEQQEKIMSFFVEFAEAARRNLGRTTTTPVEFVMLNSQTPQDTLALVTQHMEAEKYIKFTQFEPKDGPLPKDLEFAVLLQEVVAK